MHKRLRSIVVLAIAVIVGIAIAVPAITMYFHRQTLGMLSVTPAALRATAGTDGQPMMPAFAPVAVGDLSPEAAGLIYRALVTMLPADADRAPHPALRVVSPYAIPWDVRGFDSTWFRGARNVGGTIDRALFFAAARAGFTDEERAIAANIAEDSLWRDFDRLAQAPRADVIAATFTLPIAPTHSWSRLPIPRLTRLNDLSDGVGLRAAHHLAAGRRDSAEAVLGRLYALGILMDREGLTLIESFMGQRLAMNALQMRRALHEAAPVAGSPAIIARVTEIATLVDSAREAQRTARRQASGSTPTQIRQRLLAMSADTSLARGDRFEALAILGYVSCGSLRELLLGPADDVTALRRDVRRTLARSASDSSFLEYLDRQAAEATDVTASAALFPRLYRSASHLLGRLTPNGRLAPCADMIAAASF